MAHDVFISYAFEDKPTADAVCAEIEATGVRCWIAPRDILPGIVFSEAIIHALNGTRILVLVFSARANESPHVMREVERAVNRGIPIIPLRIEKVPLSPSMEYYISTPHWLDALTPPLKKHLAHLAETVRLLLERADAAPAAGVARGAAHLTPLGTVPVPRTRPASRMAPRSAALLGVGLATAVVTLAAFSVGGRGVPAPTTFRSGAALASSSSVGPEASTATPPAGTAAIGNQPLASASAPVAAVVIEPGFAAPGDWVGGIAWDGSDLWVAGGAEIFRVDEDGRVLGVFDPPDYSPEGLTWDGSRFWLFTTNAGTVYRFSLNKSEPGAAPTVSKSFDSPIRTIGGGFNHAVAWDGMALWLSDAYNVYKLDTTGKVLDTLAFGTEVAGLAWDGTRLWIATTHGPLDDATLSAMDATGTVTASHDIPVVEVSSFTWADDAFLVAGAPELGGEILVYRVAIAGAGP